MGGCFWCIEFVFNIVEGVVKVLLGYVGGEKNDFMYEEVCLGNIGYVEVV